MNATAHLTRSLTRCLFVCECCVYVCVTHTGFDARHNSRQFAHIAAAVFAAGGVKVHLPRDVVPTPFVAAGVALLGCAAGVMVTASHNTKEYNGYKVQNCDKMTDVCVCSFTSAASETSVAVSFE